MPLTETQLKYLALTWQCFETEPKVDYDKFHKLAGLASPHSARELLRVTKKKLREEYGALGGPFDDSTPSKASKAITPTSGRGKKAAVAADATQGASHTATPGSKKRTAKKSARSPSLSVSGDAEDDAEGESEGGNGAEGGSAASRPVKKAKTNGVQVKKEPEVEADGLDGFDFAS